MSARGRSRAARSMSHSRVPLESRRWTDVWRLTVAAPAAGGARPPSPGWCDRSDGLELAGLLYLPAGEPARRAARVPRRRQPQGEPSAHGRAGGGAPVWPPSPSTSAVMGTATASWTRRAGTTPSPPASCSLRRSGAPWLAARGASIGGCLLLQAAHARPGLFGALALLCPADGGRCCAVWTGSKGRTARTDPYVAHFDAPALRPFLARLDLVALARGLTAGAAGACPRRR